VKINRLPTGIPGLDDASRLNASITEDLGHPKLLEHTEPESRERPTISSRQPFVLFCGSRLPYSERDSLTWLVHRYRVRIPTID
jgi:hypothetical protein